MKYLIITILFGLGCSWGSFSTNRHEKKDVLAILYDDSQNLESRLVTIQTLRAMNFKDSIQLIVATTILEFSLLDSTLQYEHCFLDSNILFRCQADSLDSFNFQFIGYTAYRKTFDLDFRQKIAENILRHPNWFDRRVPKDFEPILIPLDVPPIKED
jgi:3-phenylpropionate/cinnamic acid dioxygenase small subunit